MATRRTYRDSPLRVNLRTVRTLVINPRSDAEFVAVVEEKGPRAASPEALQAELRAAYPRAIVRRRQLEGERGDVWYVYREGVWVPSS